MQIQRGLIAAALLAVASLAGNTAAMADTVLYNNATASSGTEYYGRQIRGAGTEADTFSLPSSSAVDGFDVDLWLPAGETLEGFTWQILSNFNYNGAGTSTASATMVASGTATSQTMALNYLTQVKSGWTTPAEMAGYSVAVSIPSVALAPDTTYLLLLNGAEDSGGDPAIYWDESGGSSIAYSGSGYPGQPSSLTLNNFIYYPSNTFQILGTATAGPTASGGGTALPTAAVPEPPSVTLLGFGLVALLGGGLMRNFVGTGAEAPAAGDLLA